VIWDGNVTRTGNKKSTQQWSKSHLEEQDVDGRITVPVKTDLTEIGCELK